MLRRLVALRAFCVMALSLWLAGCATKASIPTSAPRAADTRAWAAASLMKGATELGEWEHYVLPTKRATQFVAQHAQGRDTIKAQAESSASMLRRKLRIEPDALGVMQFSWLVNTLIADADMGSASDDDSPVRVVLVFDGDRGKFSARNAMLSELAQTLTGEALPYATLMYSWCARRRSGEVIVNPRTDRIRTQVVEVGNHSLGQWRDYERDIRADFEAAFGEPPGALVAIGVMTDADNTQSQATAWYGPLRLSPNPLLR